MHLSADSNNLQKMVLYYEVFTVVISYIIFGLLGYYMYTEVSRIAPGTKFILESQPLSQYGAGPFKLTFWYHLYGHHTGDLNVYVKSQSGLKVFIHGVSGGKKTSKGIY